MDTIKIIFVALITYLGLSFLFGFDTNSKTPIKSDTKPVILKEKPVVEDETPDEVDVIEEVEIKYSQETIDYFNEIANKSEYNKNYTPKKWKKNIKIFVKGEKPKHLMGELNRVVYEINELISDINLEIVSYESESNYIVFFGGQKGFNKLYPYSIPYTEQNYGLFMISGNKDEFTSGCMYVDIYRTTSTEAEKHLLREELTQSLGLPNDSYKYPESIFYKRWSETTEYAPIDRELIQMLYN